MLQPGPWGPDDIEIGWHLARRHWGRGLATEAGRALLHRGFVELALPRFLREETQQPDDLRPIYVRKADARISWQNRGALFGGRRGPST